MKMKFILCLLVSIISFSGYAQYIVVKARYTETRLVDDAPNPSRRENRLILSFFTATSNGVDFIYTPLVLSNFDIWVYKAGLQYGSLMGGVLDSTGNNYPGYSYPAPRAVAYYNSLGLNYIDCDPNAATHFVVNGYELDCGFVTVSYWDVDWGTMQPFEAFTAPNICLPYYLWPHPFTFSPGNINFNWPDIPPTAPYNWYSFSCGGSQQLVIRGVLSSDTGGTIVTLPVRFANVRGDIDAADRVTASWSNMTESDILHYSIESSVDGVSFQPIGTVLPTQNNGNRSDYTFFSNQTGTRVYYRIKAVENNGTNLYSNVFVLSRNISSPVTDESFSVYPNPVTNGQFTLRLTNAKEGRYLFSLVTPGGQAMKQKMITHSGGDMVRQIDLTGVPPGMYTLTLRSDALKITKKIIITN
ncbi:hypothetical protein CAP36_12350 [Chitinophagaceae bacterium IBVUCB2]|nr:hypothetical protein CAP36_12350 [Chitinophagaceae bacterium IBVUCB2]